MTKRDLVVASTRNHHARLLKYYPRRQCAPSLIKSRFFFAYYKFTYSTYFLTFWNSLYVYTRRILGCAGAKCSNMIGCYVMICCTIKGAVARYCACTAMTDSDSWLTNRNRQRRRPATLRILRYFEVFARSSIHICFDMYLLTEWEGRTGKYLARGYGVRTERHNPGPNIVPSGPT